jgi:anti-anti-sigma regulatory factor
VIGCLDISTEQNVNSILEEYRMPEIKTNYEGILVWQLPKEPGTSDELKEITRKQIDFDCILDFDNVDIITHTSLSSLMLLRKLIGNSNQELILCSVHKQTKGIFDVTALTGFFTYSELTPTNTLIRLKDEHGKLYRRKVKEPYHWNSEDLKM